MALSEKPEKGDAMKTICGLIMLLSFVSASEKCLAESATVYDIGNGDIKSIDITRTGRNEFTVYDFEEGNFFDVSVEDNGSSFEHHRRPRFHPRDHDSNEGFGRSKEFSVEVFDYEASEFKTYDVKRTGHGEYEVTDPTNLQMFDVQME